MQAFKGTLKMFIWHQYSLGVSCLQSILRLLKPKRFLTRGKMLSVVIYLYVCTGKSDLLPNEMYPFLLR